MRKFLIRWLLPILLCLLLGCVTVFAAESGSLRIVDVENAVALYPVATYDGSLTVPDLLQRTARSGCEPQIPSLPRNQDDHK